MNCNRREREGLRELTNNEISYDYDIAGLGISSVLTLGGVMINSVVGDMIAGTGVLALLGTCGRITARTIYYTHNLGRKLYGTIR
ncbi:hypothetical protein COU61_01005 [Candidatus Pacearchaeota archaeon CG10_big_fil_rev_8_21_14_0_10_35_13]|nr:MAG: hypothetical protein COU61_01005 [Candidatus Pacearchaeota archaeon CG10_big_fil_rev_8_21_14_0_10_35_13]